MCYLSLETYPIEGVKLLLAIRVYCAILQRLMEHLGDPKFGMFITGSVGGESLVTISVRASNVECLHVAEIFLKIKGNIIPYCKID